MKTLKEQQVTSLSELLKNAKKAEQTVEQDSNKESAVDRAAKILIHCLKNIGLPCLMKIKNIQCGMMVS